MPTPLRTKVRTIARSVTGFDVHKARGHEEPFDDIQRYISSSNPVLFDVGANIGQTIEKLTEAFPASTIHAFEPTPNVFRELECKWQPRPNLHLNNLAVGSTVRRMQLYENSHSVKNSLLPYGPDGWPSTATREVEVTTIDRYCTEHGIAAIDLLKTDTQGFDLEVLKGARSVLDSTKLVYTEVNFAKLYEGMATVDQLFHFMASAGFAIISMYDLYYQGDRLGWADALFVNDRSTGE